MGYLPHINWCRTSSINHYLPASNSRILHCLLEQTAQTFCRFLQGRIQFLNGQAISSLLSPAGHLLMIFMMTIPGPGQQSTDFLLRFIFSCGFRKTAAKMLAVWKFLAVLAFIARPGKSQRWWNNWKITPLHSKTSATPTYNYVHVEHHQYCGLHHHDWLVHLRHCLVHQPNWFVQRCHNNGNLEEALQSLGLGCNETSSPSAGPLVHNT